MSKIEEVQVELEQAQLAVEAAAKKLEMLKEQEKNWPQAGDDFWVPGTPVGITCYKFANTPADARYFELGMAFQTEEQCLAEVNAREVIQALRSQPGTVPFTFGPSEKWQLSAQLFPRGVKIVVNDSQTIISSPLLVYFETSAAACAALNAVGEDRIKAAIKWLHMREV